MPIYKVTPEEYSVLAAMTLNTNPPTVSGQQSSLLNMVLGLAGEAGEFVNLVKKDLYHSHDISKEVYTDEIGDIMWYLFMIMNILELDFSDVLMYNLDKLSKRYPEGFSSEASINRQA